LCVGEIPRTWVEIQIVHGPSKMLWGFQLTLNESFVDNHLGGHVGKLTTLPKLHLLLHWLEIALHSVDTDRYAIN
jgi:hypothetical protein